MQQTIHQKQEQILHAPLNLVYLDVTQGAVEARSETYKSYDERALETATPRNAKSASSMASLTSQQAGALDKLRGA